MTIEEVCERVQANPDRLQVLLTIRQPTTIGQFSRHNGWSLDHAGHVVWCLSQSRLLECLNPGVIRHRLYWLTQSGSRCQRRLRRAAGLRTKVDAIPSVDWDLYGQVCYRHRSTVIRELSEPLQPATIKRRARRRNDSIRMSANNVRDVVRYLLSQGIVRKVTIPRQHHPSYALTPVGETFRSLLLNAEIGTGGRGRWE